MPEIERLFSNALQHEHRFEGARSVVPALHAAIVTCMDSRIDVFRIFGLQSGEAHILRNAGGIVTSDILRSLVLSQRLLKTNAVILMHHTDCGLQKVDEAKISDELLAETGQLPPYAFGAFQDVDAAVRVAVKRVREHPFLQHRDNVRGFVYDVATGRVREV
ncbi:MAG: beta-class carbonic anhydrase [Vulcanimicrobiaceae bacterium]